MRRGVIAALFTTAVGVSACAAYDEFAIAANRGVVVQGYAGTAYRDATGPSYFTGSGAAELDPWLAGTIDGRRLVASRFDARGDGRIGAQTAYHANAWFRSRADANRDHQLTDEEIRRALDAA